MDVEPQNQSGRKRFRTRLLLVEDHAATADVMRRLLEMDGFDVRVAGSYREAVAVATQFVPDVFVCDIGLPEGRDGAELMRTMRRAHPGLCGIAVSGHTAEADVARFREAGFAEFLAKPITAECLVDTIQRLLKQTSCERGAEGPTAADADADAGETPGHSV